MNNTSLNVETPAKQKDIIGRRKAPRFGPSAIPSLKSIQIVKNTEVKLINILRGGALIETQEPLSPKSLIALQLVTTEKVYLLKGQVLRSYVYSIGKVLTYQSAIAFDEDFSILPPGEEMADSSTLE